MDESFTSKITSNINDKTRLLQEENEALRLQIDGFKKLEKELLESEWRYRKLFEESQDAIYISGIDGELQSVNQAALDLFGYTKQEMIGMNVNSLYINPDDRARFMNTIEKIGSVSNYEVKLKKKLGEEIDCFFSTTLRRDAEGKTLGYQGIIRDVTEHKRTIELIKAKELAERSAKMKEAFLANMSHEIRTPMNAILGMLNLVQDSTLTNEQERYIKNIKMASEHLLVLINDILDFSKIEAGKLEFEQIEFNLEDLLLNVIQTFKSKAEQKNLNLQLIANDSIAINLIGDPTRLLQILLNLVSNALKFTDTGYIQIKVKVIEEDNNYTTLSISVNDSGIGIPADKLDLIFDSFSQVSSNTTRRFGGTGLGLAITKKLIDIQGGTITVKSEVNQGSSFRFTLRYKQGTSKNLIQTYKDLLIKNIPNKPLNNLNILLVEDNELNQVVAIETIKKWGKNIKIDIAENGKIAIDLLQKNSYDIVLMDVQMPEMDGLTATKIIRNDLKITELPIIAMTAYATTGEAEKTISAGMSDYISKPFDPQKLYQKILKFTEHLLSDEPTISSSNNNAPSLNNTPAANNQQTLDLSFLNNAVGNDTGLKKQMIEIMLRETPDELALIQQYYDEQNWDRLRSVAHKFKSAVTYLGLHSIENTIKTIQLNAEKRINLHELPPLINELTSTCDKALEELKQELQLLS